MGGFVAASSPVYSGTSFVESAVRRCPRRDFARSIDGDVGLRTEPESSEEPELQVWFLFIFMRVYKVSSLIMLKYSDFFLEIFRINILEMKILETDRSDLKDILNVNGEH